MALVLGIPITAASTPYILNGDDFFLNLAGDTIIANGEYGVETSGPNNTLSVGGHIYGALAAALVRGNSARVDVLASGALGSSNSVGLVIDGEQSKITNAGTIAGLTGVFFDGSGIELQNSGLILGSFGGIRCSAVSQNITVLNSGTIRSLDGNSYVGCAGADRVTNSGVMIGAIALGDSADIYDGRLGSVVSNAAGGEVRGEFGNDTLRGGRSVDRFNGGADDDRLTGGLAKDILTGGTGKDQFIFNSVAEAGDTITDFSVADDTIVVRASAFGGLAKGVLAAAAFRANTSGLAQDSSDRFIYETDSDRLWYDSNGNAAGGRVLLADLNDVNFTRNDILLI